MKRWLKNAAISVKHSFVLQDPDAVKYPPAPPRDIFENYNDSSDIILHRLFCKHLPRLPEGVTQDTPEFALYRFYEFFAVNRYHECRDILRIFWRNEWNVYDILDPKDKNPERYAFLAACTYLMVRYFNERLEIGLKKGVSPWKDKEQRDLGKLLPVNKRELELAPYWAGRVEPLKKTLKMPRRPWYGWEGQEEHADESFREKNILVPRISLKFGELPKSS